MTESVPTRVPAHRLPSQAVLRLKLLKRECPVVLFRRGAPVTLGKLPIGLSCDLDVTDKNWAKP